MGKSYDNKCVVMCLCIDVLTSVRACMHVMGGGGGEGGDGGRETPNQYISIRSNVEKLLNPM